jgi:beta-galactosidase
MARYTFLVRLFHPLLNAGLSRRSKLKHAPPFDTISSEMKLRKDFTRRELFQTASAAIALSAFSTSASAAPEAPLVRRLSEGWEHYRGGLGGFWEVWRGKAASDNVTWANVAMPHRFNAWDAVDPDHAYYEGPGWYRTTFASANPYPNGRTLLHFEGTGQLSEVFVGLESVGKHVGGYDEFTLDITDVAARSAKRPEAGGKVELAVLCDNSRDLETIPSDLSDFNRYGGLYRHVNLVYAPAISLERVHVDTGAGTGAVSVKARLYNPAGLKDSLEIGDQRTATKHRCRFPAL